MTYESRRICFWSKTGILQRRAAPTLWNCCVAVANGSYNFGLRLRCGRSVSRKTCGPGWGLGSQMREIAPARSEMFEACQMREIRPSSQESSELSRAPAWRHRLAPPVTWPSGRDTGRGLASDPIFNAVLRAAALLACCFVGNSYDESRAGRVIYAMYVYRGAGLCLWCLSVVIVRGPRAKRAGRKKCSAKRHARRIFRGFALSRFGANTRNLTARANTRNFRGLQVHTTHPCVWQQVICSRNIRHSPVPRPVVCLCVKSKE